MTDPQWGDPWGGTGDPATIARDRLLAFVRNTNAKAIVGSFAERTVTLDGIARLIPTRFDLDTGSGTELDAIGGILQRPRAGAGDAKYRTLLQIQVLLILSSPGSTDTLLQIVDLFTGAAAPEYAEANPSYFGIGAVVTTAEEQELAELLRLAKGGGIRGTLHVQDADALVLDYTPADPVTTRTPGELDYIPADTVTGSGSLAYEIPL